MSEIDNRYFAVEAKEAAAKQNVLAHLKNIPSNLETLTPNLDEPASSTPSSAVSRKSQKVVRSAMTFLEEYDTDLVLTKRNMRYRWSRDGVVVFHQTQMYSSRNNPHSHVRHAEGERARSPRPLPSAPSFTLSEVGCR